MSDKPEQKKPTPTHETEHAKDPHAEESHAAAPEKSEAGDKSKEAGKQLADKVTGELSHSDWQKLGKDGFNKINGAEAEKLLAHNPLEGASESSLLKAGGKASTAVLDKPFNFSAASGFDAFRSSGLANSENYHFGDGLNGKFCNIFDSGRNVNRIEDMGFKVSDLGGSGIFTPSQIGSFNFEPGSQPLGFDDLHATRRGLSVGGQTIFSRKDISFGDDGNLDLGQSLTNSFWTDATTDVMRAKAGLSEEKGWFGTVVGGAKYLWDRAGDMANVAWDSIKNTGNASIEFVSEKTSTHDTPGGKVETTVNSEGRTFKTGEQTITQSNADKDGHHEHVTVQESDGRSLSQDGSVRTLQENTKDVTIKHDPKSGKVDVYDKSGHELASFNREGQALRFFEHTTVSVTEPGQSLDAAYDKFVKEHPHNDKTALFVNGNGETLTVQLDGSRLRTHSNGDTEAVYRHTGRDGKRHDIEVTVQNGHARIGYAGEQKYDAGSAEAREIIRDSRLRVDGNRQLEVNQDTSGDPRRAYFERLIDEKGHVHVDKGTEVDPRTGKVIIEDSKTHAEITPNKETKVVTEVDTTRHPDGTIDEHPSRIFTMDPNKHQVTMQGVDPLTGELKADDVIKFDENKNTVEGWGMLSTPDEALIYGEDGSYTAIDPFGDIQAYDSFGNPFLETNGDYVSYDGGNSWTAEDSYSYHSSERVRQATETAVSTASIVDGRAAALISNPNLGIGDIAALEDLLNQAVASLPPNSPIPQQIVSARATLDALRSKVNLDISVDSQTAKLAGVENSTLREYAREAGNLSPEQKARYALERAGYQLKDEA